jgi:photosystem II stability/assembly factor-like uncharacterized protein
MNGGLPLPTGAQTIGTLIVDPHDSNIVYGTAIVPMTLGQIHLNPGQLFRSMDGGSTWSRIAVSPAVSTIAADPQIPGTIYSGTAGGGILAITFPPE